jgi:hypothetical protein
MTKRKQAHTIIAEFYGMDSAEVYETRHHYGQTRQPIYVIGDDYFAVGKAMPKDEYGTGWKVEATHEGQNIWKSEC